MAVKWIIFSQCNNIQKMRPLSNRTEPHEHDRNQILKDINTDYAVLSPGTRQREARRVLRPFPHSRRKRWCATACSICILHEMISTPSAQLKDVKTHALLLEMPDKSTQSQSKLALIQRIKTILYILFQYKSTVSTAHSA